MLTDGTGRRRGGSRWRRSDRWLLSGHVVVGFAPTGIGRHVLGVSAGWHEPRPRSSSSSSFSRTIWWVRSGWPVAAAAAALDQLLASVSWAAVLLSCGNLSPEASPPLAGPCTDMLALVSLLARASCWWPLAFLGDLFSIATRPKWRLSGKQCLLDRVAFFLRLGGGASPVGCWWGIRYPILLFVTCQSPMTSGEFSDWDVDIANRLLVRDATRMWWETAGVGPRPGSDFTPMWIADPAPSDWDDAGDQYLALEASQRGAPALAWLPWPVGSLANANGRPDRPSDWATDRDIGASVEWPKAASHRTRPAPRLRRDKTTVATMTSLIAANFVAQTVRTRTETKPRRAKGRAKGSSRCLRSDERRHDSRDGATCAQPRSRWCYRRRRRQQNRNRWPRGVGQCSVAVPSRWPSGPRSQGQWRRDDARRRPRSGDNERRRRRRGHVACLSLGSSPCHDIVGRATSTLDWRLRYAWRGSAVAVGSAPLPGTPSTTPIRLAGPRLDWLSITRIRFARSKSGTSDGGRPSDGWMTHWRTALNAALFLPNLLAPSDLRRIASASAGGREMDSLFYFTLDPSFLLRSEIASFHPFHRRVQ